VCPRAKALGYAFIALQTADVAKPLVSPPRNAAEVLVVVASAYFIRALSASVSGAISEHPSFFVIFAISVCNNHIVNPAHNVRRMVIPSSLHDLQKGTTYGPSGITAMAGSALAVTLSSTAERTESMELTPVRACWAGLKPVL
jgi:hypothetical protein